MHDLTHQGVSHSVESDSSSGPERTTCTANIAPELVRESAAPTFRTSTSLTKPAPPQFTLSGPLRVFRVSVERVLWENARYEKEALCGLPQIDLL